MLNKASYEYVELEPDELKKHPINEALYGEIEVDQTLVDSIREKGQLEPIMINQDNIIISGHRRWLALKKINADQLPAIEIDDVEDIETIGEHIHLKAKCHRIDFGGDAVIEKKAIIEYNRRREKRYSQLYNEIEVLHEIYDPVATQNRLANLKNSDVTKLSHRLKEAIQEGYIDPQEIDPTLTKSENVKNLGAKVEFFNSMFFDSECEIYTPSDPNERTRKKIAKTLGIGQIKVNKITKIGRLARDHKDTFAQNIMKKLDRGELTLNAAYTTYELRVHQLDSMPRTKSNNPKIYRLTRDLLKAINEKKKKPSEAWREFKIKKNATTDYVYSIILIEPYIRNTEFKILNNDLHNLRYLNIPAAPDATLFVIANMRTLKHCIELIKNWWQFEFQSFTAIKANQKQSDNWFDSCDYILLLATRGSWQIPISRLPWDVLEKDDLPYAIMQMYPAVKSFYEVTESEQRRQGPGKQPSGWGIPLQLGMDLKSESESETEPIATNDKKDDGDFISPAAVGEF